MFKSIRSQLLFTYIILAVLPLLLVGGHLISQSFVNQQEQTLALQSELSQRVAEQVNNFIGQTKNEMELLVDTQDLLALSPEDQQAALGRLWTHNESFEELALTDRQGNELARVSRLGAADGHELEDLHDDIAFQQALIQDDAYYSSIEFDEETGEPLMTISIPIIDLQTGFGAGTLIANVRFKDVWDLIADVPVREGESVYIVDSRDRVVAHRNPSVVLRGSSYELPEEDGRYLSLSGDDAFVTLADVKLGLRAFDVVVERLAQDALAETFASLAITVAIITISLVVAIVMGVVVVNRITTPINALVTTAETIQEGDFSQRADEGGAREISALAVAFNGMTSRLHQSIDTLEQNVAARTQALETSIEVSRSLSALLTQEELVTEVVTQIREAYGYYHAHIYLLNKSGDMLIMSGGTGEAGRVMLEQRKSIAVGTGMVGRVAQTNTPIAAIDVTKDENWFHNPLLPETKSEAAVPISVGDVVLGVLDVQQDTVNSIRDEDIRVLQSIANQVAIALRNARLYADTQKIAGQQLRINEINQKIQQATTVESALQVAVRELGRAVGSGQATVQLADFGVVQLEDADVPDGNGHISLEDAE